MHDIQERLARHGQAHLLEDIDQLDAEIRERFLARLAAVDWAELAHPAAPVPVAEVGASRVVDAAERIRRGEELVRAGEQTYAEGAVAVLIVAGGQGTRLGYDGPKGCFSIGALSGKSIYQIQAEKVAALSRRTGHEVPLLVMTSPMTDAATRAFFAEQNDFGLAEGQVRFFCQGTVPSIDSEGHALLAAPGRLLENPDGHGGCFTALVASGRLAELERAGIRRIVYIQVDNILAPVDDPELVGLAELEAADVVTKVLAKAHPDEKVGHLVRVGDRDRIIEYTELSQDETRLRNADGELVYRWGSPAMHCWGLGFLHGLAQRDFKPPLHRSAKPLQAWVDGAVQQVQGWKCERFIFDLIPEAPVSIGLELDRTAEFAPVKNADEKGVDCPATARRLASDLYASWLRAEGVEVVLDENQHIEISPLYAATARDFSRVWDGRCQRVVADYLLEA